MEAKFALADRMSSLGTLVAGIAHEINNPLAYVMANLDVIADELDGIRAGSPVEARIAGLSEMVADARVGADRVRQIVRGLRAFSRADDERRTVLDVRKVIDVATKLAFNEIRHRAKLVTDFGDAPFIHADEGRLVQVFVNLLVNAAQAIPEGNADRNEIRVRTRTHQSGAALIAVEDTGAGIPPAIMGRIFDPFFTTKDVGEGTGLGLSILSQHPHEARRGDQRREQDWRRHDISRRASARPGPSPHDDAARASASKARLGVTPGARRR